MAQTGKNDTGEPAAARWGLVSLALSMLMPSLDTSIANAGLPALAQALAAPFQHLQWVVLAYLLTITAAIVAAGRIGDSFGRRRLLLGGIALFTLASTFCGLAPSLPVLVAARALQGVGAAAMLSLTMAMVGDAVPKARIGRAMGLLATMSAAGTALGPALGGLLIATWGWRAMFFINVPVGIVNLVLALRYLPAADGSRHGARAPFDVAGTVLLAASLVAYALALTMGHGRFAWYNGALLAAAAAGLAAFVRVEARAPSALLNLALFRLPGVASGAINAVLVAAVMMTTLVVGPFYLTRGLHFGTATAGLVMAIGPLTTAISGLVAGRLVDRFGAALMSLLGLAGMAVAAIMLCLLPSGVVGYIAAIVLLTAHYAVFQTANNAALIARAGTESRGVVSGLVSLARNLGLVSGAAVMGAVFATASGWHDAAGASPAATVYGMKAAFAGCAGLMVAAVVFATVSYRTAWTENSRTP